MEYSVFDTESFPEAVKNKNDEALINTIALKQSGQFENLELFASMVGFLWTVESGTLYKTSIKAMEWQKVGQVGEWATTIAMTASDGFIWSVEKDGTLFKSDSNGQHKQVGPRGQMTDVEFIAALDGYLYVVENGTLFRTKG